MGKIFCSDRRIRLGIWGLGRGANLVGMADALNIDIVGGCDINDLMRENFRKDCPGVRVTADENEFLSWKDMDAVLIATYFFDHTGHIIKALKGGFHVLCEVTPFQTPADGVRLVEAVEKSGKIFNLLENYPFTKENLYLQELWSEGYFGDFLYGEFDYFHECRKLCYCYNDLAKTPVEPGYTAHNWRSWFDMQYYATHSLGPVMKITGLRPEMVTAFSNDVNLPGYLPTGSYYSTGTACPSMIKMSNGGLMRNLCGSGTGDYHSSKRLWGTRASAESIGYGLHIQPGACGNGPKIAVAPKWPEHIGEFAEKAGHGGGDFIELFYFAREVLEGIPAPWDIYSACDVTLGGIMAVYSKLNGGQPQVIPDFRKKEVRDQYRNDPGVLVRMDLDNLFPAGHDKSITCRFTALMGSLHDYTGIWRKALDGAAIFNEITGAEDKLRIIRQMHELQEKLPKIKEARKEAAKLIRRYPDCPAACALKSMISLLEPEFSGKVPIKTILQEYQRRMLTQK